jgi:hypothetical protein
MRQLPGREAEAGNLPQERPRLELKTGEPLEELGQLRHQCLGLRRRIMKDGPEEGAEYATSVARKRRLALPSHDPAYPAGFAPRAALDRY